MTASRKIIRTPKAFPYRPVTENGLTHTIAMVRLARLANAMSFCLTTVDQAMAFDQRILDRHAFRAIFMMGGYLYEIDKLLKSIAKRYSSYEWFEPMDAFWASLHDFKLEGAHNIIEEINFHVAFHSDWDDSATPAIVKNIGLPAGARPAEEGSSDHAENYYSFVDSMDMEYLIRRLYGRVKKGEVIRFVSKDLRRLSMQFVDAANDFVKGITSLIQSAESEQKT